MQRSVFLLIKRARVKEREIKHQRRKVSRSHRFNSIDKVEIRDFSKPADNSLSLFCLLALVVADRLWLKRMKLQTKKKKNEKNRNRNFDPIQWSSWQIGRRMFRTLRFDGQKSDFKIIKTKKKHMRSDTRLYTIDDESTMKKKKKEGKVQTEERNKNFASYLNDDRRDLGWWCIFEGFHIQFWWYNFRSSKENHWMIKWFHFCFTLFLIEQSNGVSDDLTTVLIWLSSFQ